MRKILSLFAAFLFLASCSSTPPTLVRQDSDTSPKINLDVLTLVVLDRSTPLAEGTPYATNNFQPTIANAIRRWVTDKVVATGGTGEAIVVIRDASLKAEPIPHPDSMFTREQTSKYTGHAEIELNITRRNEHGQVTAETSAFETLPDDPSSIERQNAYYKILNTVMRDLNTKLRMGIRDHLASFVAASPAQ